jgi:hypothetical protein
LILVKLLTFSQRKLGPEKTNYPLFLHKKKKMTQCIRFFTITGYDLDPMNYFIQKISINPIDFSIKQRNS